MKHKIRAVSTTITGILFFLLASTNIPFLFFAAFLLLLARGIAMFIEFNKDVEFHNEDRFSKTEIAKIIFFRIGMQLIPVIFIIICFYIFFLRKEVWNNLF